MLGPFFFPNPTTTLTKRRLYAILFLARPVFFFLLGVGSTLGVCPFTFPARARPPCTFPLQCMSGEEEVHGEERNTSTRRTRRMQGRRQGTQRGHTHLMAREERRSCARARCQFGNPDIFPDSFFQIRSSHIFPFLVTTRKLIAQYASPLYNSSLYSGYSGLCRDPASRRS